MASRMAVLRARLLSVIIIRLRGAQPSLFMSAQASPSSGLNGPVVKRIPGLETESSTSAMDHGVRVGRG